MKRKFADKLPWPQIYKSNIYIYIYIYIDLKIKYIDSVVYRNAYTIHVQIHIQIHRRTLLFQVRTVYQFLASVLRLEGRNTIFTMLTIPNAQCILWCLCSLSVEIRKCQLHLSTVKIQLSTQWQELNFLPLWSNLNFNFYFSKSSNSQDHLFRALRQSHSSPIFCLRVYYDIISFAFGCKTVPNDYAPELVTRIVQSPTKLNDKI